VRSRKCYARALALAPAWMAAAAGVPLAAALDAEGDTAGAVAVYEQVR
jgi:hypothetical protein